ncbi:MAG: alkaline phosphatase family protein [Nocardioidaceae bacterium]
MDQRRAVAGGGERRTLLRSVAAGSTVVLSGATGAPWVTSTQTATRTRAYVLAIDGLRPDEIHPALTPRLARLRAGGRWFPYAQAVGAPGRPTDLGIPTIVERLQTLGLTTGTVLSTEHLYEAFGTRATYRWEPEPLLPVIEHALDSYTSAALQAMVHDADPDMVFVNFGDIGRSGHADVTGSSLRLTRRAALANTDRIVGGFVDSLRSAGKWDRSVGMVLAHHSTDRADPDRPVSLGTAFADDPLLAGNVAIADNGGANLLSWTGDPVDRAEAVRRMRTAATGVRGVLAVHKPEDLRIGPRGGDLVAYCEAGRRFSDPQVCSDPAPDGQGRPPTAPIPFFLTGGSPLVRPARSSEGATTADVAPTIGEVFGLDVSDGGYDGTSRL